MVAKSVLAEAVTVTRSLIRVGGEVWARAIRFGLGSSLNGVAVGWKCAVGAFSSSWR